MHHRISIELCCHRQRSPLFSRDYRAREQCERRKKNAKRFFHAIFHNLNDAKGKLIEKYFALIVRHSVHAISFRYFRTASERREKSSKQQQSSTVKVWEQQQIPVNYNKWENISPIKLIFHLTSGYMSKVYEYNRELKLKEFEFGNCKSRAEWGSAGVWRNCRTAKSSQASNCELKQKWACKQHDEKNRRKSREEKKKCYSSRGERMGGKLVVVEAFREKGLLLCEWILMLNVLTKAVFGFCWMSTRGKNFAHLILEDSDYFKFAPHTHILE